MIYSVHLRSRNHFNAWTFLACYTHIDGADFRPCIFNMDSCKLGTLHARLMCRCTCQHAQSAVRALALFQFEHCIFSLTCTGFLKGSIVPKVTIDGVIKTSYARCVNFKLFRRIKVRRDDRKFAATKMESFYDAIIFRIDVFMCQPQNDNGDSVFHRVRM